MTDNALQHQVAGHADSMTTLNDGQLLVKSTAAREVAFYDELAPRLLGRDFIGKWTPTFYGTLQLHGRINAENGDIQPEALLQEGVLQSKLDTDSEAAPNHAVVLENITHNFVHPNVIDFKLGTQLFDDDSAPEKVERMRKAAESTTSGTTGLRLTGCKIWNSKTQTFVTTDKKYGKSITAKQLPEAIRKAFPCCEEGEEGLPRELLKVALRKLLESTKEYIDTVKDTEWRLYGSSLLYVYEGDAAALESALSQPPPSPANSGPSSDDESSEDSANEKHRKLAYAVKAIDFAHAWDYTGKGPDSGYNLGLSSLRDLLAARLAEIERG